MERDQNTQNKDIKKKSSSTLDEEFVKSMMRKRKHMITKIRN